MKSFREFVADQQKPSFGWLSFDIDGYSVHIFHSSDEVGALQEARHQGTPLGGRYSAQLHQAHAPGGQRHLHIYARRNQLFALNVDGTAHDDSHGAKIPSRVAQGIAQRFPEFEMPKDRLIEWAPEDLLMLSRGQLLRD